MFIQCKPLFSPHSFSLCCCSSYSLSSAMPSSPPSPSSSLPPILIPYLLLPSLPSTSPPTASLSHFLPPSSPIFFCLHLLVPYPHILVSSHNHSLILKAVSCWVCHSFTIAPFSMHLKLHNCSQEVARHVEDLHAATVLRPLKVNIIFRSLVMYRQWM